MVKEKKDTTKKKAIVRKVRKVDKIEAKPKKPRIKKEMEGEKEAEVIIPEKPTDELQAESKDEESQIKYYEGVGRRKTAIARVRLFTRGEKAIFINDKTLESYFTDLDLEQIATSALRTMKCLDRFRTLIKVKGGGLHAQSEAIRHGSARALILFNQDFRKRLRKAGFLTRDSRKRERKKFGLKRARRAPQWSKR